ncbi:Uu.00g108040.m01.CDS01 [Anthostomella pinea]|uniref:Uu.00g108040.m01.CDS01 n=1 Tax=Anthostomella pinea TaxID=933095 RepID=A0AAI8V9B3_9PEZI|nr:Uu.00g108040.m01.CDS01 [Anthostomella pinea]
MPSAGHTGINMSPLGHQRLLLDIREMIEQPYPNITLIPEDHDIRSACLVLTPDNYEPLHLTVRVGDQYPLNAPEVSMDSDIIHPNVFGDYICATILNTSDGWTPAYTLKGTAIQLLSFFDSESLERDYGGGRQDLADYQNVDARYLKEPYKCNKCHFGSTYLQSIRPRQATSRAYDARVDAIPEQWPILGEVVTPPKGSLGRTSNISRVTDGTQQLDSDGPPSAVFAMNKLPNEVLLLIIDHLEDFKHLTTFASAWPRVSAIVRDFDVVRQRELQCFCLKQGYQSAGLGVGVDVNRGQLSSEFELLSRQAYRELSVRWSIHHVPFQYWLPLPISRRHWGKVKGDLKDFKDQVNPHIKSATNSDARFLFTFMNDIVVRLNEVAVDTGYEIGRHAKKKSTLLHASEKAIESYFHLFHLLVCLATENPSVVQQANQLLQNFAAGKQSKTDCPNLGHLLIALLISDVEVTEALTKSIVTEAITRNVVWLLNSMPELSFMERQSVSPYRLDKTFQGSRTSYRLLMFSELFRRTARPSHQKPLTQVRDELFERHGAPPRDAAARLASEVRRLHTINDFPAFMKEMGIRKAPAPDNFTDVLRKTVDASMRKGYSRPGLTQDDAMLLRHQRDPDLLLTNAQKEAVGNYRYINVNLERVSFFPGGRGRGGFRGGRGDGRGRGNGNGGRGGPMPRGRGGYSRGFLGGY